MILEIDGVDYKVEGGWNELSRSRLIGLCRALITAPHREAQWLSGMCFLLRLKVRRFIVQKRMRQIMALAPEYKYDLVRDPEMLGWMQEPDQLTAYTISKFWFMGKLYMGPPKRMMRIPIIEMVGSRLALRRYFKNQTAESMDEMLAILFRPINPLWILKINAQGWTGDKRVALNDYTTQRRAKRFRKLDPALKLAILKQYSGALTEFEKRHKLVFDAGRDEDDEETPKDDGGRSWINLLFDLSGGIYGDKRHTEQADSGEVFLKIAHDMQRNADMERRMKAK
jgi:hypothetical protein